MKKLRILKVDKYDYILEDYKNNKYKFNIEFQGIEKFPKENDIIYIPNNLLNKNYKEYSNVYTFGNLDNNCGRNIINEEDIIILIINNNKYYLKRLYG